MRTGAWTLLIVLVGAGAFVVATSQDLPATVASHFGAGGRADGFMTRGGYIAFMLVLMAGLAALFAGLPRLMRRLPPSLVNLPSRDYWLAPERREATWDTMERWMRWFGCAILAFIAYVHYLVVIANEAQPAVLPERPFLLGIGGFIAAALAWGAAFLVRFRRPR